MIYKIIVDKQPRTNPSPERREYEVDIDELCYKDDAYDTLVIEKGRAYVVRRTHLSKYNVLTVLDEPVIEELGELHIELFEGDNYVYLDGMEGNLITLEYLVKNDFTDLYVTKNEMDSEINQTADKIELSVDQKLTRYTTNEELEGAVIQLNSKITQTANEITSTVSKTYTSKGELNTAKTEIKQTTDNITNTVSKKVGENEIISKINQSAESVGINANKIKLSANDVLNLLAGNTINLSSRNINISSNNFTVDVNGKATLKDVTITGGNISLIKKTNMQAIQVFKDSNKDNEYKFYATNNVIGLNSGDYRIELYVPPVSNGFVGIDLSNGTAGQATRIKNTEITTPILHQTSVKSKKKNIKKCNVKAVDLIKNADICNYNLKGEKAKSKKHIGLVIGDGYNCPDEVISEDGQGVEQYSMTSLAWKAIQEQQEIIEQLLAKVARLEEQNG